VTTIFSNVTVPVLPIPAAEILVKGIIHQLLFYLFIARNISQEVTTLSLLEALDCA
jgi:hypothetical protein